MGGDVLPAIGSIVPVSTGSQLGFGLMLPLQLGADYYLTQVFNGLVLGMIFVLLALGLSIIFGMMGIINFAHGDLVLVGTYTGWAVFTYSESILLAFLIAPIVVALIGAFIERFTLRYTYGRSALLQLLLTFGLAEILREGVQILWGRSSKPFPIPAWGGGMIDFGLFTYPVYRVFILFATMGIVFALYLFLNRTDIGLIIRAGTYDREMVDALGIDINRVFLIVFALGAGIAGLAGALIGPVRGVNPLLGVELLIPSFVVVVVGGTGSLWGTVLSGLIIGQLIVMTGVIAPQFSQISIFVFMALVLLVRPKGLFGREGVFA